jgi:hypothetical protein
VGPAQLAQLIEVTGQENIEIRVIDLDSRMHLGMAGSFTCLTFADDVVVDFAYQETASEGQLTEVASLPAGVRDSKRPDAAVLTSPAATFAAFVAGITNGQRGRGRGCCREPRTTYAGQPAAQASTRKWSSNSGMRWPGGMRTPRPPTGSMSSTTSPDPHPAPVASCDLVDSLRHTGFGVVDRSREVPVGQTRFLWAELTGLCQLECRHCYASSSPAGTHGAMTRADWVAPAGSPACPNPPPPCRRRRPGHRPPRRHPADLATPVNTDTVRDAGIASAWSTMSTSAPPMATPLVTAGVIAVDRLTHTTYLVRR